MSDYFLVRGKIFDCTSLSYGGKASPDMWWRSEVPINVPVNSFQEFGWEFELIVTFPHAGTTANLPVFSVPKVVLRNITEVN